MRLFLLSSLLLSACEASFPETSQSSNDDLAIELVSRGTGADNDGDGYGETVDCDDTDEDVNPGEDELCANGIDDDCDDLIDDADGSANRGDYCYDGDQDGWCEDYDGDGEIGDGDIALLCDSSDSNAEIIADQTGGSSDNVSNYIEVVYGSAPDYDFPEADCDDEDVNTYPDAPEVCDGADNDCDASTVSDESSLMDWFYADTDSDGYGDATMSEFVCEASTGYVSDDTDCDDGNIDVNPGASESCNEVDDNCDGSTDEGVTSTFYADADSDGYGDASMSEDACSASAGYVSDNTDCDDINAARNPGATEVCDMDDTDEDCDGLADDFDPEGDASGMTNWYTDFDVDGYAGTFSMTSCDDMTGLLSETSDDCDDSDASINPSAEEVCDGVDNDCDASTDDETTWYHDLDGDLYGNAADSFLSCTAPSGYVSNSDDCDDTDADVNPDATEMNDGVDNDCDGLTDSDDDSLVCYIELALSVGSAYTISEFNVTVSNNSALDGDFHTSAPSGVTYSETTGSEGTRAIAEFEACLGVTDIVTVDVEYTDGSQSVALDGTTIGGLVGYQDVDSLLVQSGTTDLGDGYGAFEATNP